MKQLMSVENECHTFDDNKNERSPSLEKQSSDNDENVRSSSLEKQSSNNDSNGNDTSPSLKNQGVKKFTVETHVHKNPKHKDRFTVEVYIHEDQKQEKRLIDSNPISNNNTGNNLNGGDGETRVKYVHSDGNHKNMQIINENVNDDCYELVEVSVNNDNDKHRTDIDDDINGCHRNEQINDDNHVNIHDNDGGGAAACSKSDQIKNASVHDDNYIDNHISGSDQINVIDEDNEKRQIDDNNDHRNELILKKNSLHLHAKSANKEKMGELLGGVTYSPSLVNTASAYQEDKETVIYRYKKTIVSDHFISENIKEEDNDDYLDIVYQDLAQIREENTPGKENKDVKILRKIISTSTPKSNVPGLHTIANISDIRIVADDICENDLTQEDIKKEDVENPENSSNNSLCQSSLGTLGDMDNTPVHRASPIGIDTLDEADTPTCASFPHSTIIEQ